MPDELTLRKLFPNLEDGLYEELLQYGNVRSFAAGSVILKKGHPIRSTMMVIEGVVKLYQDDDEGDEFFVYHLEPGQACALSMVCNFGHEKSEAMAKALTDVVVLSVPLQYMEKWLGQYKSWHYFVIKTYRSRYNDLLQTVNEIAFRNMDERLEFYLLKQVKQFGNHVKLTHQEIANDLNSSREVISRLMKKMEKNGWISIHRNSFEWLRK
ncbi:MAG: Crp/Fnr family transcriptional regulator [Bacteroidetes bacterium]|jgi:cAMP-binding proteins - catabolite gene activator and regulatory subunit of cAMP-dependent protein kinases|uniref:Crp/Fnr family transcriptional regulator n=1 Tax=Phnomibacter sp. TaxID=2836217 RepID=UPI002FDE7F69|nr:Crp/Fnr family transcriptional regulator [Bacteroidota bacterium]